MTDLIVVKTERERERERQRQTDRQTERQRERVSSTSECFTKSGTLQKRNLEISWK